MADKAEGRNLRRKRRKLGLERDNAEVGEKCNDVPDEFKQPVGPVYDFLHLASLAVEMEIPILFPGKARPRSTYNLLGSGGSFLVFTEPTTMDDVIIQPNEVWSLADRFVLKRTRSQPSDSFNEASNSSTRYASIMAELQILTNHSVREHENIIDFLGLTWDFEPNTDGSESAWPVLALEAAECTLETQLYDSRDGPVTSRLKYCHDIAKALDFLHDSGVVHCDIKMDNVLICFSSLSGVVAKLTDFGSAILGISPETYLPHGIAGTLPWNAPEWNQKLKGLDVLKADVFSFSMLIWRAVVPCGVLEDLRSDNGQSENLIRLVEAKKRSDEIIEMALEDVRASNPESQNLEQINDLLQRTLMLDAKSRCGMTEVRSCLEGMVTEYLDGEDHPKLGSPVPEEESSALNATEESPEPVSSEMDYAEIQSTLLAPFGDDFEEFYERFENEALAVKQQLITSLKAFSRRKGELPYDAAEAAYQVSRCYIDGFGVSSSVEKGLEWSLEAARAGNLKAKADIYRLALALSQSDSNQKLHPAESVTWLAEAGKMGSTQALTDLKKLDRGAYEDALASWNQRFCQIQTEQGAGIPCEDELLRKIESLPKNELDAIELNDRGHGFVHVAASLNYVKGLQKLIGLGVDINKRNRHGENALLCACRAGNAVLALDLLSHDAKAEPTLSGETPLHWLISCDDAQVGTLAKALAAVGLGLEVQHTITESNEYNFDVYPHGTPLDWAVSKRKISAVTVLVEMGADPFNECSQYSPFVRAVSLHDVEVLKLLLSSGHATAERKKGFDSTGQTLLFHAVYCNTLYTRMVFHGNSVMNAARNTIRILLDHGCDPGCIDKDGESVMNLAAGFADREMVKMLLDEFSFSNIINSPRGEQRRTPLHHAISSGRLDVVQLALSQGADPYCISGGKTLLHSLAGIEDETYAVECLKLLNVSNRADLNTPAIYPDIPEGLTPFEFAVFCGHLRVADYLLSQGADPRGSQNRDPHFLSLLISEASWYSLPALEYHVNKVKPDFIVRPKNKLTALHVAASMHCLQADTTTAELKLDILLRIFSRPDQINARTIAAADIDPAGGQTPLHYAAKFGAYFGVRRLLEAGADVSIVDDEGCSALESARKYSRKVADLVDEQWMTVPRAVRELHDAVDLLECAVNGRPLPGMRRRTSIAEHTRARFSRMGFKTYSS